MEVSEIAQKRVQDYSNSKKPKGFYYSNSTVTVEEVLANITDLVPPHHPYVPYYKAKFEELGFDRFMALANYARARHKRGHPSYFFRWCLEHSAEVTLPDEAHA
jgi:hypothetical protein